MEQIVEQIAKMQFLNQFWMTLLLIIPMVLISRSVVAGTRYSPILIIVLFGLGMGYALVKSDIATPGLPEFPLLALISKVTIVALVVSFFVGGQEIKKIFKGDHLELDDIVIMSGEETILGTKRTQFYFLIRSFFVLLAAEGILRLVLGVNEGDKIAHFYPLIAYVGVCGSIILIDNKATIKDKAAYIRKGLYELIAIVGILFLTHHIAVSIKATIALPQIFFAMIVSAALGMLFSNWIMGPTGRSLLFAGIPVVLAANFMIGGSRIAEAFKLEGMTSVMAYGFFGQIFWMFGGLALLMFIGKANHVRNLAPGMAGSLSHAGLTGACTAGDLGSEAAARAPIMINVPFFGHIFVFTILAMSVQRGQLIVPAAFIITVIGIALTAWSLKTLKNAEGKESEEVKGLMQFSFGWQLTAVFGGFYLLYLSGMDISSAAMAKSSAISHFGLFAATQGGMFGTTASTLIPFIFAMPFLVHPLVFGIFGNAMEKDGYMSKTAVLSLSVIGTVGIIYALTMA
ncbi:MAG: hypothetical protein PWR01_2942 [Clostridiales bacterium]|jgi:hypothetical protein|nr:hypothetical protein [Clostridiales bacterium]MDN5281869.1 hypothetical protein [Candidatus Ozemobacter sp.]